MSHLHPAYDWRVIARMVLSSRLMDELEENELNPQGHVVYQFSARGHELGQVLASQLLAHPADAAGVYYRSRPFMLGSGLTLREALASGMARTTGVSGGRDVGVTFSMPRRSGALVLPMAGDVGSQYTPAAGWAQALQYRVRELAEEEIAGSISVAFGGDGSVASNGFWSALTIATTLKLPLLFFIEDNGYAISVTAPAQTPGGNIAANLASFGNLQIWSGDGTDPAEAASLVNEAVSFVRGGQGPGLLRLTVPRLSGHSGHDNQAYKSDAVREAEEARDPLPALRDYLVPALYDAAAWDELVEEVRAELLAARDEALADPEPAPESATRYVWAERDRPQEVGGLVGAGVEIPAGSPTPSITEPRRINMIEAIRRTLDHELATNPRCLIFGEDVGKKGGVHTATMGLQATYGSERVFDTSLSEEGIVGRAVGMALAGLMPVPEIQFRKYADPATEQIHNCGTIRWRTNNRFAAPILIRVPGGFGRKIGDPWHSVTSESVWAHAPGWHIAIPAHAGDAVGLLRSALRNNNPTIFFEHRAQMDAAWARRPYPGDEYVIPFGRAARLNEGDELTVISWGAMVERCEKALGHIDGGTERVELLDLRTIVPWDKEQVLASVRKTSKVLIVHEDIGVAGFGAEIAATITQEAFMDLDAPVERLTTPVTPIPFNLNLMAAVVPTVERIQERMEWLLGY